MLTDCFFSFGLLLFLLIVDFAKTKLSVTETGKLVTSGLLVVVRYGEVLVVDGLLVVDCSV